MSATASSKNPLAVVKDKFGDKAKLVEAVEKFTSDDLWVARTNKGKGLAHVSNTKLLRLHATFSEVKEKFGTREKLIDAILELEKRVKDAGYRQRLLAWPVPRLYDTYKSTAKRLGASKDAAKTGSPKGAKSGAKPAKADKADKAPKAEKAAKPGQSKPKAAAKKSA
jgi:hypothetical protein